MKQKTTKKTIVDINAAEINADNNSTLDESMVDEIKAGDMVVVDTLQVSDGYRNANMSEAISNLKHLEGKPARVVRVFDGAKTKMVQLDSASYTLSAPLMCVRKVEEE